MITFFLSIREDFIEARKGFLLSDLLLVFFLSIREDFIEAIGRG